ncbi:MAG: type II toxin-antitoxin system VapC family toxin, partial [Symploca sp. SIO1B1]|nr:type II toxin-antitoxin system VapC family toxin [Symploca sp. SIO1B1]
MTKIVLLDTNPLSQVVHPKAKPEINQWLQSLQKTSTVLRVPEIADYEVRRELIRAEKHKSIARLNEFNQLVGLISINTEVMRKAARLWAWVRNQGLATASKDSLDGDVILAAQAILQLDNFQE